MDTVLIEAVENIDETMAMDRVRTLLDRGVAHQSISNDMNYALQRVAKRYEEGEFYIADLIMAGELVSNILKMRGMDMKVDPRMTPKGKIIVGTVFDDIHDVGKNIFISMLHAEGFDVVDLGTDVPAKRFVEAIRREKPEILGISGILTSVVENIKVVIEAIRAEGLRDDLKIILGGALAGEEYARYVGADGYSSDAIEGVNICKQWLSEA